MVWGTPHPVQMGLQTSDERGTTCSRPLPLLRALGWIRDKKLFHNPYFKLTCSITHMLCCGKGLFSP